MRMLLLLLLLLLLGLMMMWGDGLVCSRSIVPKLYFVPNLKEKADIFRLTISFFLGFPLFPL